MFVTTVAGTLSGAVIFALPASAIAAAGSLDPSFGSGGQISFPLSLRGEQRDGRPTALMFTAAGDLEIAGTASPQVVPWHGGNALAQRAGQLQPSSAHGKTSPSRAMHPDPLLPTGKMEVGGGAHPQRTPTNRAKITPNPTHVGHTQISAAREHPPH